MQVEVLYATPADPSAYEHCMARLPEGFRQGLETYARPALAMPSLLARVIVAEYLSAKGILPAPWATGLHGKPHPQAEIHFSISHSKGAVAVAFSQGELGLDVEKIRPLGVRHQSFGRFFAPEELAYIGSSDARFFELWTRKEALIKADGRGLSLPVAELRVLGSWIELAEKRWHWVAPELWPGYSAHLATAVPEPEVSTRIFRL